ncbi:MAG: hypothetical protein ACETWG_02585 [Candidatus Neomarinimicrobiota bacterium]
MKARSLFDYFSTGNVNYEDVFSYASEVRRQLDNEKSPMHKAAKEIDDQIRGKYGGYDGTISPENYSLLRRYIRHIAREMILNAEDQIKSGNDPSLNDYLSKYGSIISMLSSGGLDIFTLNHDNLLEEIFSRQEIAFEDGFQRLPRQDICTWDLNFFKGDTKVRLFKLHGGSDWLRLYQSVPDSPGVGELVPLFYDENGQPFMVVAGPQRSTDYYKVMNIRKVINEHRLSSKKYDIENADGMILVGKSDKFYSYAYPPYLHLLSMFAEELEKRDKIIVAGYGFGDDAINRNIDEWQSKAPTSRQVCYIGYSKGNEEKSCEEMSQSDAMIQAKLGRVQISKCSFAGMQSAHASETIGEFLSI